MDSKIKNDYQKIARSARLKVLEMIYKSQVSHIGSNFSCIDILTVLFDKADPQKDEVILSKGWAAASWYFFLHQKEIITEDELNSFCQPESPFIGLVEPMNRWGLKCAGGSMGFGLPFAIGFALAKKLKGEEGKVYCLMSDGEQQIGTTWESALIASHHKLDNLIVIVDNNSFQAMGRTREILNIEMLSDKFISFGWETITIDGHNYGELESYIFGYFSKFTVPKIIIAHTIKGKGVSFMENNNEWHYRNLDKETYELAKQELR